MLLNGYEIIFLETHTSLNNYPDFNWQNNYKHAITPVKKKLSIEKKTYDTYVFLFFVFFFLFNNSVRKISYRLFQL